MDSQLCNVKIEFDLMNDDPRVLRNAVRATCNVCGHSTQAPGTDGPALASVVMQIAPHKCDPPKSRDSASAPTVVVDDGAGPGRPPLPVDAEPPVDDRLGLGAGSIGPFACGVVDEVNGPGSVECAGFRPTQYELRLLAEHWARQALSLDAFYFVYAQTGSTEWRLSAYSNRRYVRIAEILGNEAMQEALAAAKKKVQVEYGLSDQEWAIFERRDPDEWKLFQDAAHAKIEASDAAWEGTHHRAAAKLVIAHRSGYGRPTAITFDDGRQLDGQTQIRWEGDDLGRTDAVIQSLLAGPLAEARVIASQSVGEMPAFDLSSPADNLLVLPEGLDQVEVGFLVKGTPLLIPVDAGPFRAALERLPEQISPSGISAERVLAQMRIARQRLNDPLVWSAIAYVVDRVRSADLVKVNRREVAGDDLTRMLALLDI